MLGGLRKWQLVDTVIVARVRASTVVVQYVEHAVSKGVCMGHAPTTKLILQI